MGVMWYSKCMGYTATWTCQTPFFSDPVEAGRYARQKMLEANPVVIHLVDDELNETTYVYEESLKEAA